jgi:Rrf2 family protein
MLRLTTKGEYGVRAMLEIAKNYDSAGPLTIKEISERQDVSVAYLEQILNKLRRAGIIYSLKGPGGGYVIAEKPEEISIGKILKTLEGPFAVTACLVPDTGECNRMESCVSRLMWKALSEKIENFLDAITLQDLILKEKQLKCLSSDKTDGNNPVFT